MQNADNVVELRREPAAFYPALVPDGEYTLTYHRHKLLSRFNRGVLELWFAIYDANFGEHHGKQLVRYYNVRLSAKGRGFTTPAGSDFVRDYTTVFGTRPDFTRAPLESFKSCFVVGRVETVKTDHRQKKLPKGMHYSTVRELLRGEGG